MELVVMRLDIYFRFEYSPRSFWIIISLLFTSPDRSHSQPGRAFDTVEIVVKATSVTNWVSKFILSP